MYTGCVGKSGRSRSASSNRTRITRIRRIVADWASANPPRPRSISSLVWVQPEQLHAGPDLSGIDSGSRLRLAYSTDRGLCLRPRAPGWTRHEFSPALLFLRLQIAVDRQEVIVELGGMGNARRAHLCHNRIFPHLNDKHLY